MWKYTSYCVNHIKTAVPSLLQNATECFTQQTRNTFILRRKYKLPLVQKHKKLYKLPTKSFIYEFVENKNSKKQAPIEVILLKDVVNFGLAGDKVSIHPEVAYNKLLLPKIAVYASPENMKKYYVDKKLVQIEYSSHCVKQTMNSLALSQIPIEMSSTVLWTIENWHVKVAFRKMKFIVPETAITLPPKQISGPDPELEDKQFFVVVTINNKEQVKVRCTIKHWKGTTLQIDDAFLCQKGTAVFPEDQPILDAMPVMDSSQNTFFK